MVSYCNRPFQLSSMIQSTENTNPQVRIFLLSFKQKKNRPNGRFFVVGCGDRIRTCDLRVMSPTSYQLLHPASISSFFSPLPVFRTWCRRPGSNRYENYFSRDFKSRASANSATPANNNLKRTLQIISWLQGWGSNPQPIG